MKVLAIESSSAIASCAICDEDKIIGENWLNAGLTHSKTLMVLVEGMFKLAEIEPSEVDLVAVSCGPGSFTGLRIGVSAAEGIAKALRVPCAGVSTLLGLASNFRGIDALVCPVLDARGGYIYCSLFKTGEKVGCERLCDDRVLTVDGLISEIKNLQVKLPLFLVGDAASDCYLKMKDSFANLKVAPIQFRLQKAASVAFCGIEKFKAGDSLMDMPILNYLRRCQAERQRLEKLKDLEDEKNDSTRE